MSEWTDDVEPEEPRRRNDMRRAILGGVAGVTMLVAPIVLANAIVPEDEDVQADATSERSLGALQQQDVETARLADQARLGAQQAIATTTTTAPPPPPPPPPPPETTTTTEATTTTEPVDVRPDNGSGGYADPYNYATWDRLAECESGGNWQINTGNGYYGGLQFSASSWRAVGGTGLPHEHSRDVQIEMGIRLYERQGWGAWPACTAELGYR
jgi:Transglycosylase-like domain